MNRYKHLFFDLDHTLWDFRSNSRETLRELYADEDALRSGIPSAEEFIAAYEEINHAMWASYAAGRIPKEVLRVLRFRDTLALFGIKDGALASRIGHAYTDRCPQHGRLMPGALQMLGGLRSEHRMHIITNGFDEIQGVKLERSGIASFFDVVLTSERAGAAKPDPRIFAEALKRTRANAHESLMIGDNVEADMLGARRAGWDHVHYTAETDPDPEATHRIAHWDEFAALLRG